MEVFTLPGQTVEVGPQTAFGELRVEQKLPVVQVDAVYGLLGLETETFTGTGGSVTVEDTGTGREFKMSTGTSIGGYGIVRSKAALRYRPGVSATGRFTARFDTPVALSRQAAGFVATGTELSFGYNGTDFGILYRRGGLLEIRTLTVSSAATTAETATVTLNGTGTNVSLTGGGDTVQDAREIAATSFTGWQTQHVGSTVIFIGQAIGPLSGTYSYATDGDSAASFAQTQAGRAVTDTFITQAEWNGYDFPELDPSKGNVYQIEYQYLGYGALKFYIENKDTGRFQLAHTIKYPNTNESPSLTNPSLKLGVFAASLGSTTNMDVYAASLAGFVDGRKNFNRQPNATINSKTGIGTSATPVLSIKNSLTFNDFIHLGELLPLAFTYAVEGTKPAEVFVYLNGTLTGPTNWQWEDADQSPLLIDTASTGITTTNARLLFAAGVGKSSSDQLFFPGGAEAPTVKLYRGDTITIAVRATSGTTDATASITVMEE